MKFFLNDNKAFTLIELLVSIAIIFILIGLGIAGYTGMNQRQTLINAALNLKNVIRDAQSRAINSEYDCNTCGGAQGCNSAVLLPFTGWKVDFVNNEIYGNCGNSQFFNTPFILVSPNLSDLLTITTSPNTQVLSFSAPPNVVTQDVTFCLTYNSLYYKLHINPAGTVDDYGIVANCP